MCLKKNGTERTVRTLHNMATGRIQIARVITLFLLIKLLLIFQKFEVHMNKDTESIFIEGLHLKHFPTRNGKLPRTSKKKLDMAPYLKLKAGLRLTKLTLYATYLILIAGDIERNPGPIKDPCCVCSKGCHRNQRAIQCDECNGWFHARCVYMKKAEYNKLSNTSLSWQCLKCLYPGELFDSSISDRTVNSPGINHQNCSIYSTEFRIVRGFKIAHLNVNRLRNKLDDIQNLLSLHSFHVLTISETWLNSDISDDEIAIPGYSTIRKDRHSVHKSCGGGLIAFIRNGIPYLPRFDHSDDNIERLWLEIRRPNCKKLLICCVYRPDDQSIDDFLGALNNDICKLNVEVQGLEIVIIGDFNVDITSKRTQNYKTNSAFFA